MGYFDNPKNVEQYIEMMRGFDNAFMLDRVFTYLPPGGKMLELGIGAGLDLDTLKKSYDMTGSDLSAAFLDAYRSRDNETPLKRLDAVTLDIDERFDYIYSNKVLIHLPDEDLKTSFQNQARILNNNGLVMHTFWRGRKTETLHGLLFNYQRKRDIVQLSEPWFRTVHYEEYTEISAKDSFIIILKKK